MGSFRVELGPNSHDVHVGSGLLDRLGELARAAGLKPGRTALVTDSNVARLFGSRRVYRRADAPLACQRPYRRWLLGCQRRSCRQPRDCEDQASPHLVRYHHSRLFSPTKSLIPSPRCPSSRIA